VLLGEKIIDFGQVLSTSANHQASFGILVGAVVSRLEPGVRKSILAEMQGATEPKEPSAGASALRVTRCVAKPAGKKTPGCSRA
jgi:hypothetical protein